MDDDNKDSNSSFDNESTECHFERGTHSVNITGQGYDPRKFRHESHTMNGGASINNGSSNTTTPLPVQTFSTFRDHIKTKASLTETFINNLNRNNNNCSNNNYNHLTNNNSNNNNLGETLNKDNYNMLQANSKKLMDSARKQHKYLAKRKILMHYNEELNGKRLKELERYNMDHDANNNNNEEMNENENENVPQHNNFKIRLMENQLKANQEQLQQQQHQQQQQQQNNNHTDPEEEEEALNLVQNNSHDYHKSDAKLLREPSDLLEIVETEPTDMDQTSESDAISIKNCTQLRDEDDINNNNPNKKEAMEIDNNNNTNMKNFALINAINKKHTTTPVTSAGIHATANDETEQHSIEHSDNETRQQQQHNQHHHQLLHHHHGDSEDDNNNTNNNNNNKNNNKNDSNNNNHHQLDLSTVKSIATAEILCGLKSKVFKMEDVETREMPAEAQCRNLSEIKQAE